MTEPLLEVKNLRINFKTYAGLVQAVRGVDFTLAKGETLAIVGESGSGKSVTSNALMRLIPQPAGRYEDGQILFEGKDLLKLSEREMESIRGNEIAMIFQDPMTALNPTMRVGKQIMEVILTHKKGVSKEAAKQRAIELLAEVGIPDPERRFKQYPHEFSGGMRQRVIIAIAIACKPPIVIADEPTTALDVTIQAQILDLLKDLQAETQTGIILITHDLGVVAEMADRVAVMYGGQFVEVATAEELFANPKHPYTRSLLNSIPQEDSQDSELHVIEGVVPSLKNMPRTGCRFAARIPWIPASDHEENPVLHEVAPDHLVRCTCYKHFHFRDEEGEV